MTQAGPLTLAPATPLASASGWLPRIGTLALLVGMGLLVLPPLLYLASAAVKAGELGAVTIGSLVGLAVTTLSLATLATIWAMLLALPLAWLVIRTDLPFRTLCRWLAVIPLAIPSYVGAMSYIALLGPVGSVNTWLRALIGQHMLLRRRAYVTRTGTARLARPLHLGRWRWPAGLLAGMVLSLSVFIPLGVLLAQTGSLGHFLEVVREQGDYIKNSLLIAGLAATLAAILGLLIAFTARHTPPRTGALLSGTIQIGYAIPGTVLGLSLILLYNTYIPWVYGTVGVLVVAYLIRFLTQSVQGVDAALTGINPHLEEAARSLAASPWRVLRRVLAPLVRPTLFAVWALVFISAMKELDATLLLRPAGFDTLPVRVYIHTVEAEYARAAVMALLLIAFTALPWMVVTRLREKKLV